MPAVIAKNYGLKPDPDLVQCLPALFQFFKLLLYVPISSQRENLLPFLQRMADVGVPSASEYLSEDVLLRDNAGRLSSLRRRLDYRSLPVTLALSLRRGTLLASSPPRLLASASHQMLGLFIEAAPAPALLPPRPRGRTVKRFHGGAGWDSPQLLASKPPSCFEKRGGRHQNTPPGSRGRAGAGGQREPELGLNQQ